MESSPETNLKGFSIAFGTTEFLGALAVVMMTVWVGHYRGGYSWSSLEPDLEFNWHPVLMTVSMIFLYGNYLEDSILTPVQQAPARSTHDIARATNISKSAVHQVLYDEGYHPYYYTLNAASAASVEYVNVFGGHMVQELIVTAFAGYEQVKCFKEGNKERGVLIY
uniref:Uncharacterized protein n=1 Tax=Timema genevievae TaxID=629358 RepID=A0A7R9PNW6_TIMGE|nr:unnamed protein product [Timema genevievae]